MSFDECTPETCSWHQSVRGREPFDFIYYGPSGAKRYDVWRRGHETFLSVSLRGPSGLQRKGNFTLSEVKCSTVLYPSYSSRECFGVLELGISLFLQSSWMLWKLRGKQKKRKTFYFALHGVALVVQNKMFFLGREHYIVCILWVILILSWKGIDETPLSSQKFSLLPGLLSFLLVFSECHLWFAPIRPALPPSPLTSEVNSEGQWRHQ